MMQVTLYRVYQKKNMEVTAAVVMEVVNSMMDGRLHARSSGELNCKIWNRLLGYGIDYVCSA